MADASIGVPDAAVGRGKRLGLSLGAAALIIVIDQLTKIYFNSQFQYGERLNVLPFFDFTLLFNRGAAFSFLASEEGWQRWLFTILGVGAALVITWLIARTPGQPRFRAALTLIMGGALGNVIDRLIHGHVIDFLLFYWKDWAYPAFNIADITIVCGAILLVLDEILRSREKARAARSPD
ncbi:signal peptidase II [Bordetella genomosp. 1]|uniref:Lipoprotein signal peptidase n=1 Tax=Bordetella genomosp. 1 TaxID=1395607 RepID=A0A261SFM5_9BORD|nr:signal peptidase II [Bordetella genomosp. 1]MDQ8035260.1 signal peptidase II [Bordetella sp.]OZI36228.1 signal peptidase II [Bordetella genomosp. 1]OZI58926.1 signal peptidase II [Bordetella genomosp. 1]